MKKLILAAGLLIVASGFAQKDELKTLKKIYDRDQPSPKDVAEYKSTLIKAEPLISDPGDKVYFDYYKAFAPTLDLALPENQKNPMAVLSKFTPDMIYTMATTGNAVLDYEKKSGKKILSDDIEEVDPVFNTMLLNYAVNLGENKKEADASKVLYSLYLMNKKDQDNLYYAASYAVNAQDYESAMKYYQELKQLNYTGEKVVYSAKSKLNDKYFPFPNKAERDQAVRLGTHFLPKQENEPSKKGEIYKNIALILISQGKEKEAFDAISDARKENPGDVGIMMSQADLYLKQGDNAKYKEIVNEILSKDPNNVDMIYNLGVVAMQGNQDKDAEDYFKKAIALKPDYENAYVNLTALRLKPDKELVDKMNALTTSAADTKKYEVLKAQRETIFKELLPDLEKAHKLLPANETLTQNLMSVYGFLEMTDKRNALKG